MTDRRTPAVTAAPRAVAALIALAVSAFCYVAMETLPVGILPLVATDLDVTLSHAGLLVTGYAITVAIVSVPLTYVHPAGPRRRLLGVLLGVLVVATLVSAAARDYQVLLWTRVVVALTQALFWAVVAPTAAGISRSGYADGSPPWCSPGRRSGRCSAYRPAPGSASSGAGVRRSWPWPAWRWPRSWRS